MRAPADKTWPDGFRTTRFRTTWSGITGSAGIGSRGIMALAACALAGLGGLACDSAHQVAYDVRLVSATRQAAADGDRLAPREQMWFGRASHKDEDAVFAWTVETTHLGLVMTNKTSRPLTLHWDRAVLTDEGGRDHRVAVLGTGGAPIAVAPRARWSGGVYPADYEYEPGKLQPLLPSAPADRRSAVHHGEIQDLLKLAGRVVGKSVVLSIPASVGDAEVLYRLEFEIRHFDLRRERE